MNDTIKALAVISLLITIFGTIGNLLVFITCMRIKNNTTFTIMRYLAISDIVCLYFWNLDHFVVPIFDLNLQATSLYYCKIADFLQYSSLQISAWLLVIISFDRFFSVIIQTWKSSYLTPRRALFVGAICVTTITLINFQVLFTFGHVVNKNGTESVECYATDVPSTKIMAISQLIHSILYSYMPFSLLALANILLILTLYRRSKASTATTTASLQRQRSMNITVMLITLLFIAMTCPSAVVSIYYNDLIISDTGFILILIGNGIGFGYHGFNFFALVFSNSKFKTELKGILRLIKKDARLVSTSGNSKAK